MATSKEAVVIEFNAKDNASGELKRLEAQMRVLTSKIAAHNKKSAESYKVFNLRAQTSREKMDSLMSSIKAGLPMAGKAAAVIAAIGIAATKMARSAANAAEKASLLSERLGLSVETMSELGYAARQHGHDMDKIADAVTDLNEKMVNSEDKFEKWGIRVRIGNGAMRETEDVLLDVMDKLAELPTSAERVALANDLMSSSGRELLPFLQKGSGAFKRLSAEAKNFGATITSKEVQEAKQFQEQWRKFETVVDSLARKLGNKLIPFVGGLLILARDTVEFLEKVEPAKGAPGGGILGVSGVSAAAAKIGQKRSPVASGGGVASLSSIPAGVERPGFGTGEMLLRESAADEAARKRKAKEAADKAREERQKMLNGWVESANRDIKEINASILASTTASPGISLASKSLEGVQGVERSAGALTAPKVDETLAGASSKFSDASNKQLTAAMTMIDAATQIKGIFSADKSERGKALAAFLLRVGGAGIGGAMGGLPGAQTGMGIGSGLSGLFFGMSSGGTVPMTAGARQNLDSVPTMLTPGEYVLTKSDVRELKSRLSGGGSGGGINLSINAALPPTRAEAERLYRDNYAPAVRRLRSLGSI